MEPTTVFQVRASPRNDGEYDRQHEAAFIDRDNLGDIADLDGVEIAQPRGSGGETGQDQEYPAAGAY